LESSASHDSRDHDGERTDHVIHDGIDVGVEHSKTESVQDEGYGKVSHTLKEKEREKQSQKYF